MCHFTQKHPMVENSCPDHMMDRLHQLLKAWGNRHPTLRTVLIWGPFYPLFQVIYRYVIHPLEPAGHPFGVIFVLGFSLIWCAVYLPIRWGPRTSEFKSVRWMALGCLVIGAGMIALAYRL